MGAAKRREEILTLLKEQQGPVSATMLAKQFHVSRQIIVGDIALLRASGADISATPRGYLLARRQYGCLHQVACLHSAEDMERELMICVDNGCTVQDVIVEHPVYGQITGQLQLSSPYDVRQFIQRCQTNSAHALSELTDGIHLHTLRCAGEEMFQRTLAALEKAGFLLKE